MASVSGWLTTALASAWLSSTPARAAESAAPEQPSVAKAEQLEPQPRGQAYPPGLRAYLQRPVPYSARFLDHGVLAAGVAGGWPHRYRLELSLGLLDHLTIGVTANWLPDASKPRVSPKVALAFWRSARFEVGAHYFQSLFPPSPDDDDPTTPSFERELHWFLGSFSVANRFASGGLDIGAMRYLDLDPALAATGGEPIPMDGEELPDPSVWRWSVAGGLHLRAGTRRWGFTFNLLAPAASRFDDFRFYAEVVFDVRFGIFEARPKGGWRPPELIYSTDRRVPPWR